MWRSRPWLCAKSISCSLGNTECSRHFQYTPHIYQRANQNKKLSWSVWITFKVNCLYKFLSIFYPVDADTIPPQISNIPNSIHVETNNGGAIVNWEEPTASDNSGTANLVRKTREPGSYFPLGIHAVSYVFADPSNNAVSATFFVTVSQRK